MPGQDRTGPMGQGPLTGRGLGPCGRGMRRGMGRRMSGGFGRGFGLGREAFSPAAPVYQEPTKEQEMQYLEQEAKALEEEQNLIKKDMEEIKKRIEEMKKSK